MKKLSSFILILFFGLILIGCQNHIHNYKVEVINPACITKGYITYTCDCGDSYQDNEIDVLGHNYGEWEVIKEATEEEKGLKERKCNRCGDTQKEYIPLLTHIHKYNVEVISPTCEDKGYILYTCNCGDSYQDNEVNALEHTESDWIIDTDSTCKTFGTKYKECIICKKVLKTKEIGLKDHNYVDGKCSMCGKERDIIIDNGYIYFGKYPQTLKEDSVTVSSTPDNNGYYKGSDGERYAKVFATPYEYDTIYFNDTTSIVECKAYYFKIEPIKWKIESESNGTYKLISEVILDCQVYYSLLKNRAIDGQLIYSNNYEHSDIRKWLNNDFLNKAFTEELQAYISTIEVDNSSSSTGVLTNKYICNNTFDKVYLPSYEEMTNTSYGYDNDQYEWDTARRKQLTDYAKALGCLVSTDSDYYNNGYYWLRSPSYNGSDNARIVSDNGDLYYVGRVSSADLGVAPALTLTIN